MLAGEKGTHPRPRPLPSHTAAPLFVESVEALSVLHTECSLPPLTVTTLAPIRACTSP